MAHCRRIALSPLAWTLALNGLLGLAAWRASHMFEPRSDHAGRAWAAGILGVTWLILGMQVLGNLTLLARGPLLGWMVIGIVLAFGLGHFARSGNAAQPPPSRGEPDAPVSRFFAILAFGLTLGAMLIVGIPALVYPVKVVSDGPIYHLYFAAQWWKAQRLFLVPIPFGESGAPYFPANGDLWFAWLMTAWGGDRLARIGQAPALAACGWLIVVLAMRLGAKRAAAVVAACWFLSILPILLFSFEANVDTLFAAGFLAGIYGLVRYDQEGRRIATLSLSGLSFGLAWGCKPTGTLFVAPLVAMVALALIRESRPRRKGAIHALAFCVFSLIPCGYWFARNIAIAGNPLYPAHLAIGDLTLFAGWYDTSAMSRSPYFLPIRALPAFWDIVIAVLDPRLAPIWLLALAGFWRWGRPRSGVDRIVWSLAALAVLNVVLYWVAIPYRTQQRFMLHAFGLAAIPLALLFNRRPWITATATVLLAIHLFTPYSWPFLTPGSRPPWSLSTEVPQPQEPLVPLKFPLPVDSSRWLVEVSKLVLLTCGILVAWLGLRRSRGWIGHWAAPLTLIAIVAGATAWHELTFRALRLTYPTFEYLPAWSAIETISPETGLTIAYSGTDIPYYLMARGLRNNVRYINIDDHPDYRMHDYQRAAVRAGLPSLWPDPRPGWDRLAPDRDGWLKSLKRERVQLLVVARANPAQGRLNPYDGEGFPIERRWADERADLFRLIYADPRIRVYSIRPIGRNSTD